MGRYRDASKTNYAAYSDKARQILKILPHFLEILPHNFEIPRHSFPGVPYFVYFPPKRQTVFCVAIAQSNGRKTPKPVKKS